MVHRYFSLYLTYIWKYIYIYVGRSCVSSIRLQYGLSTQYRNRGKHSQFSFVLADLPNSLGRDTERSRETSCHALSACEVGRLSALRELPGQL